jgi:hypothetical protein
MDFKITSMHFKFLGSSFSPICLGLKVNFSFLDTYILLEVFLLNIPHFLCGHFFLVCSLIVSFMKTLQSLLFVPKILM